MLEFDSFTVCGAEKELTGLNVNIYMPTAKTDDYLQSSHTYGLKAI